MTIRVASLLPSAALLIALWSSTADPHDPSAWGGLFRSRDHGARWLPVTAGRFVGGALGLAISPADPHHLLLGTDSGLLRSRNGGRDWTAEAPGVMVGAVFSAAFDSDGVKALAATADGAFRTEDGVTWRRAPLSRAALPARALLHGAASGHVYLAGANGLWRSDDWGASWTRDSEGLPESPVVAAMALPDSPETLYVVAGHRLWTRTGAVGHWEPSDVGMPEASVDTVSRGIGGAGPLWAVAMDQLYRSDDRGRRWRPVGRALPEHGTAVRGVAVGPTSIVLTTDRGLLRSTDDGRTWELQEGVLPVHLEAGPLLRDPAEPDTLYAGFALTPYEEIWRMAVEGGSLLDRLDTLSLAGGAAFLVVVTLVALVALRRLGRHYRRPAGTAGWPPPRIGRPAR